VGGEATRYKFPDIRPFVSFEMGQFSRDLMVIAFLGGHIAFHPVQCVRPIYQGASLSSALLGSPRRGPLPDKGGCGCRGGVGGKGEGEEEEEERRQEGQTGGPAEMERKKKPGQGKGKEKNARVSLCACARARVSPSARAERDRERGMLRETEREREREREQWEKRRRGGEEEEEEERCRPRSYRKSLRSGAQQSARWSCPARLQTGSGRGVAAELNYYKLPRHSYRMHAPAGARKSSTLRQPSTSRAARWRLMLLSLA